MAEDSTAPEVIALDRASVRSIDADGRLHIAMSNISKADVNPYYGEEIPDFEKFGLEPKRVYYMLRDPDELAKAAPTFNNLPILAKHMPVNAEAPAQELVIGSTGTDARFEEPYLQNSAVIWVQDEIDDIENESKREWSCGYRYTPDMTAGKYNGLHFDGIMRDIVGNHVALVHEGRAGPDVVVADTMPRELKTMAKPRKSVNLKITMDEGMEIADVVQLIGALNGVEAEPAADEEPEDDPEKKDDMPAADEDDDKLSQVLSFLDGKLSDDDASELARMVGGGGCDEEPDGDEDEKDDDKVSKPAMDKALARVRADTIAEMNAIAEAREAVAPHIGKITVAQDSAEAVYKLALDAAGVDTKGVHPSAFKAMVAMLPRPDARKPVTMDSARNAQGFAERFPNASRNMKRN